MKYSCPGTQIPPSTKRYCASVCLVSLPCRASCSLAYFQPHRVPRGQSPGAPIRSIRVAIVRPRRSASTTAASTFGARSSRLLRNADRSLSKVRDEKSDAYRGAAQEARSPIERDHRAPPPVEGFSQAGAWATFRNPRTGRTTCDRILVGLKYRRDIASPLHCPAFNFLLVKSGRRYTVTTSAAEVRSSAAWSMSRSTGALGDDQRMLRAFLWCLGVLPSEYRRRFSG